MTKLEGWGGLGLALALSACGAVPKEPPERQVVFQETKVAVVVGCVPKNLKAAPAYPDTDAALKAAPGAPERYVLLGAGRVLREQRLRELEPVVAGCPREDGSTSSTSPK